MESEGSNAEAGETEDMKELVVILSSRNGCDGFFFSTFMAKEPIGTVFVVNIQGQDYRFQLKTASPTLAINGYTVALDSFGSTHDGGFIPPGNFVAVVKEDQRLKCARHAHGRFIEEGKLEV
jgi:hypothetical protein